MATLSAVVLNRTLLHRQHLLRRTRTTPHHLAEHLVGQQAQRSLDPYLGLAARAVDADPHALSDALVDRSLVRTLTLRGTIHLHRPDDALTLPRWTAPLREREVRSNASIGSAREVDRRAFERVVRYLLAAGPVPVGELGESLAERFPGHDARRLAQLARSTLPMVQVPPRATWGGAGGVVYQMTERWLGAPERDPDVPGLVRRYLRAFGPATTTDVTTWSGVTRLAPVMAAMTDLVRHQDERGRTLFDVPGAILVDAGHPAPVRLLGTYDNLWLSHADRDRVTRADARARWSGPNGGTASAILVDGWVQGFWTARDGRVQDVETLRRLTRFERDSLDEEIERTEAFLAR